ncbi:MAG: DNA-3-methyladenine glycosylase [Syntrophomonadaceae bacterium]
MRSRATGARRRPAVLDRSILAAATLDAARALIGAYLVRDDATGRRVARIDEVEAYIGEDDRASHARFGRTSRNETMWGIPGLAYVYLVYGMYDCLNVVTEPAGRPAAVLVRAATPTAGSDAMRASRIEHALGRRRLDGPAGEAEAARIRSLPVERLTLGPGVLAAAFGLDRTWTGTDLCDPRSPLRIEPCGPDEPAPAVVATPRIGVGYAGEPWVSRPWRLLALDSIGARTAGTHRGRPHR